MVVATSRARELEEWFTRGLDAPESQRPALIDQAPPPLRDELRRLLSSVHAGAALLESPTWDLGPPPAGDPVAGPTDADRLPPGTRAGEFTITQPIGVGGMGVVYRAQQDHPRRTVALKVLDRAHFAPDARRRFARECQTLARLNHPAIVPIYGAGAIETPDATLPYFAMELVQGQTLHEWLNPAKGQPPPTPARRLELLARIADAVEHAHQRGVLHRDLKPANVLIDPGDAPRVLDFGVARLLDDDAPELTQPHALVGTLAYMSPEQLLHGATDTRSDLYSLGLLAWEALAGAYPFPQPPRTLEQAMAQARARRLPDPEPLARDLPRDLARDAALVLRKALAPDPDDRYPAVGALADDLRRLARGLPVRAAPPTPAYILAKYVRRHPAQSSLALAALVAILSLGVLLVLSNIDARREATRAQQAAILAQQRLDEQRQFVMDTLVATARRASVIPGGHTLRSALLRDALPRLDAIAAQSGDDHQTLLDLSHALMLLGNSAGGMGTPNTGELELAAQLMDRSVALAEHALAQRPDSIDALVALDLAVAGQASLPGPDERRHTLLRRCIEIRTRVTQINQNPGDNFSLAYRYLVYGDEAADLNAIRTAIDLNRALVQWNPAEWEYRVSLGTSLSTLGDNLLPSDPTSALDAARQALDWLEPALREKPTNYSCARFLFSAHITAARAAARLDQPADAADWTARALDLLAKHATDPTNTVHVRDRGAASTNLATDLGNLLTRLDPADPARPAVLRAAVASLDAVVLEPASPHAPWPDEFAHLRATLLAQDAQWRQELRTPPNP